MKCDTIAEGVIAAAAVDLKVPLVVRMKAPTRSWARRCWRSPAADHQADDDGRSREDRRRRLPQAPLGIVMSIPHQQRHQGHHPGHHGQDRPVPHPRLPGLRQRQELLRRRRQPEEGGEFSRAFPSTPASRAVPRRPAPRVGDLRAAAGAADAIWEAVEADLDLVICITEGIPIRDMLMVRNKMKQKEAQAARRRCCSAPTAPA